MLEAVASGHTTNASVPETILGIILVLLGLLFVVSIFNKRVGEQVNNRNTWAPSQRVSPRMHRSGVRLTRVLGPLFLVGGLVLLVVGLTS